MEELRFSKDVEELLNRIDSSYSVSDMERFLSEHGVDLPKVRPLGEGILQLLEHEYRQGYLAPSMFTAYYRCARRLWIEAREGRLLSAREYFWILRGRIAEILWREEHPGFSYEVELLDEEEKVRGIVDALKVDGGRVIVVEVKSGHRVSLGHRLQTMMYAKLVEKSVAGERRVETYLVYRHGVRRVRVNEELLKRYRRRVEAAISHSLPPPPPPDTKYCSLCPWYSKCRSLPKTDWDEWLISIGDYPKGPQCADCQYRSFCRSFRGITGKYPCESSQETLPNTDPALIEAILKA